MDSTSLLHLLAHDVEVFGLSFDYGQKHRIELERLDANLSYLAQHDLKVQCQRLDLSQLGNLYHPALLNDDWQVPEGHYERVLQLHNLPLRFNLLQRIQLPNTTSLTPFTSLRPRFFGLQIAVPERPCLTLSWSRSVNVAIAICSIKENTIAIGKLLQALPNANFSDKVILELFDFHFRRFGKRGDLFLVHPHEARSSCAAVAAARTFELQSIFVPGFVVYLLGHAISAIESSFQATDVQTIASLGLFSSCGLSWLLVHLAVTVGIISYEKGNSAAGVGATRLLIWLFACSDSGSQTASAKAYWLVGIPFNARRYCAAKRCEKRRVAKLAHSKAQLSVHLLLNCLGMTQKVKQFTVVP